MASKKAKTGIIAGVAAGALIIGGGALAFAENDTPPPASNQPGEPRHEGDFVGTVEAPSKQDVLGKLATVTEQEARDAALKTVPGTVEDIDLGTEDGWVVWDVDIRTTDGGKAELMIDAGDVTNVAQDADDRDDDDYFERDDHDDDDYYDRDDRDDSYDRDDDDDYRDSDYGSSKVEGTVARPTDGSSLAKVAKVTAEQASEAALKAVPGTIKDVDLDTEDGWVVWEIEVASENGQEVNLLVDAGSAKVLHQETDD